MKNSIVYSTFLLIFFIIFCNNLTAIVGPVIPGQSLWCINKRIASEVDNLESKLDHLCHATMITGPTVITMEGAYCLGNTINGVITIAASNVDLDLSNRRVTQGIIVNSGLNQVTIHNGTVLGGSDAISVLGGSQNITIEDVVAKNGIRGISLNGVTDAWITNCEMVLNTTGLELTACHKVAVTNCVAGDNTHAGFSLLSTTTCNFENCKALSTGVGNTNILNTTVFGFVASNGYGNIFERCIANSTQAFTTTDANSLIAGFALRGVESGTKIIDSEAANSTVALGGITIPYGILLESRFDSFTSVTAVTLDMPGTVILATIDWSPDGQYLAVGGSSNKYTSNDLRIYKFDRGTNTLVEVTSVSPINDPDSQIIAQWSPDGKYLAVTGDFSIGVFEKGLFVYRFDRQSEMLVLVNSVNPNNGTLISALNTIAWSPDGKYLAGGGDISNNDLVLFKFDRVAETLTQVFSVAPGGDATAGPVSMDWSPDGLYLAVGAQQDNAAGNDLFIYKFDRSAQTLTQVVNINPDEGSVSDVIRAVEWSPNGIYLAVGGQINGDTNNDLFIYRFNRSNETLSVVDSVNPDGGSTADQVFALSWSPDGTALAVGGLINGTTNNDLFVYKFNRNNEKLTEFASLNPNGGSSIDFIPAIDWSPDGQMLAFLSLTSDTSLNNLFIFRTFQFPFKNVIKNNTIYSNSGGRGPQGIGISGSNICNLIVGNTAYSNPINPSIIETNYQFVCNVFDQLFGSVPSDLQNISISTCEPIFNPDDVSLLVKQNINRTIDIQSKIDQLVTCAPIPLTNASITSLQPDTITIDEPGCYCLSADLAVDIVITVSCVCVDLMERCLKGTITIQTADDVVVKNGFVNAPAPTSFDASASAITIDGTANSVTLDKIMVDCADTTASDVNGRTGILSAGNDVQILNCTVKSGSANLTPGLGLLNAGGDGISIGGAADHNLVKNCIILATGSGQPGSAGNNGARAGHGIAVGVTGTPAFNEVIECIVFSTGNGGSGGSGATTGGDGGHAIEIGESAIDTSVRNCTLRNTGIAGNGGAANGDNGRAVNDLQTTAANFSMIFSNFAHNIANAVKYNIQNTGVESGVLTPNPPTSTVVNPLANVYAS